MKYKNERIVCRKTVKIRIHYLSHMIVKKNLPIIIFIYFLYVKKSFKPYFAKRKKSLSNRHQSISIGNTSPYIKFIVKKEKNNYILDASLK